MKKNFVFLIMVYILCLLILFGCPPVKDPWECDITDNVCIEYLCEVWENQECEELVTDRHVHIFAFDSPDCPGDPDEKDYVICKFTNKDYYSKYISVYTKYDFIEQCNVGWVIEFGPESDPYRYNALVEGYTKISFYCKAVEPGQRFELKFENTEPEYIAKAIHFEINTIQWERKEIGLEAFTPEIDLRIIRKIVFGFNDYMGSSEIYIDCIKFE